MMGLFDLPAPLFAFLDRLMLPLPAAARLAVWAALGAGLSMLLYKLLSPQRRIAEITAQADAGRRDLNAYDGEFAGAWPLIRGNLALAGRRLWLVTPPALLASLPLIAMIVWIAGAYGYYFPDQSSSVAVRTEPPHVEAQLASSSRDHRVLISGRDGRQLAELPLREPVPVIEKRHWWNVLFGNPAGYLPARVPAERVLLDLPRLEVLPVGPGWLRTWEAPYFALLVLFSLIIKRAARIE